MMNLNYINYIDDIEKFFDEYSNETFVILNETNDYDEFYKLLSDFSINNAIPTAGIVINTTRILKKSGINPKKYLTTIPECYHYQNFWLTDSHIVIPDNITNIGICAFQESDMIQSVVIPSSVTTIGSAAFVSCVNLDHVELNEGLRSIESGAFASCKLSDIVVLPRSLTYIGWNAFAGVDNLKLKVYENSYAHTWVKKHSDELTYEVI